MRRRSSALSGEAEAAEAWIAEAARRASRPTAQARLHLAAAAVLDARRGDAGGALRRLDADFGELDARGLAAAG
jgi:hypothetical protein